MDTHDQLSIGDLARRSGMAASALRYYEALGLITSTRSPGDRRRYQRSVLRRVAVIRAAQRVGLTLEDIGYEFAALPPDAAPTKKQWAQLAARWKPKLDARIEDLTKVRDNLSNCIGCGCLSMRQCVFYNPQDTLSSTGPGPRRLFPSDLDKAT